jgi:hypothetical protein
VNVTPQNTLPHFLTKAMIIWLFQYYTDSYDSITEIGCFEWKIKIDKRNPTKPKKIPLVKESHKLKSSSFSRNIYFLEENQNTLFVYLTTGFALSGQGVIYQYNWNGVEFIKQPKKIFSIIR